MDCEKKVKDIRNERHKTRFNVITSILFATFILVAANICASRAYMYWRYDNGVSGGLTGETLELLSLCKKELTIVALFERSHPFRKPIRHLLKEYSEAAHSVPGLVFSHRTLDVNRDIVETAEIMKAYNMDINSVLIKYGTSYRVLNEYDLSAQRYGEWSLPEEKDIIKKPIFMGEMACSAAIMSLVNITKTTSYFLGGHGEYVVDAYEPKSGISDVVNALNANGISTKTLHLSQMDDIPSDCNVLIIAGATTAIPQREIEIILRYIASGGNVFIMFDDVYANGLLTLMETWGVRVEPSLETNNGSSIVASSTYGNHVITKNLNNIITVFSTPHFLVSTDKMFFTERADKPKVEPLIFANPDSRTHNNNAEQNSAQRYAIATSVELGGTGLSGTARNTKIVICGDSKFASNAITRSGYDGNIIFFVSAVKWLAGHSTMTILPPTSPQFNAGISPQKGWSNLVIVFSAIIPFVIFIGGYLAIAPLLGKL